LGADFLLRKRTTVRATIGMKFQSICTAADHRDRIGQYSIRINQQWRVCFEWPEGQTGPSSVEIIEYH
jgi:plasmid maintenance system killer protein